ncbi:MAG: CHAD domain-containing protein [Maricaulaceae bacterium]
MAVQLERARAQLEDWRADPEAAFHNTRRRLKRIRAAARAGRAVDAKSARRINAAARDAAQALSDARDADVIEAKARELAELCADEEVAATFNKFSRFIARRAGGEEERAAQVAAANEAFDRVETAIAKFAKQKSAESALKRAAQSALTRADLAFLDAHVGWSEGETPSDEARHDWRKRVKDQWYIGRLLSEVWPLERSANNELADAAGKLLGAERDLLLLSDALKRNAKACGGVPARDAALAFIETQRAPIIDEAEAIGRKLHKDAK